MAENRVSQLKTPNTSNSELRNTSTGKIFQTKILFFESQMYAWLAFQYKQIDAFLFYLQM